MSDGMIGLCIVYGFGVLMSGVPLSIESDFTAAESVAFALLWPLCLLVLGLLGIRGLVKRAIKASRIE